jgi:hypothetical protein
LFGKETGLGWDLVNNTVQAPDDWWERKQMVCDKKKTFCKTLDLYFGVCYICEL